MMILHLVWHKKDCFVKAKTARFSHWYYFHKLLTIFDSYFIFFARVKTDYSILVLNCLNILHTVNILKIDAEFNT